MSLFFRPGMTPTEVSGMLARAVPETAWPKDLVSRVARSPSGGALFWGGSRRLLIQPPFPMPEPHIAPGYEVEPLRALLERDFTILLVLVRLGAFAAGICRGEQLVASKTGTGLVHSRHRKGGSSQRRFERHRENQIERFLQRVCGHVRQLLEAQEVAPDYIVYGGARTTIQALRGLCPFLGRYDDRALPPLLDIPQPRSGVLRRSVSAVWSSTIVEWHTPDAVDTPPPVA